MCSNETKGKTTVLFSFEGLSPEEDLRKLRRDLDLDEFSQVLRGSVSDDRIADMLFRV